MSRRLFNRKMGKRRYKRMIAISAEGIVTEREYFIMFNTDSTVLPAGIGLGLPAQLYTG